MRALWSQVCFLGGFFKTIFGFLKMDIYKCPKSISLFTFGKFIVTEKIPYKYTYKYVTIYDV